MDDMPDSAPHPAPLMTDALRDAAAALQGVSDTPRLDAELLAAFALGCDRMDMLARLGDLAAPDALPALIARRAAHEPVAYITGHQGFWDIELRVTPDVLIPRADSETLIEAAENFFTGAPPPGRILDLGTGSGALLLAALSIYPAAKGLGMDASEAALAVARGNAAALGFTDRAEIRRISWRDAEWAQALGGPFDLILCNPPYVESDADLSAMVSDYEPHSALFAGKDGLDDYRIIIPQIADLLAAGGMAAMEIGHEQAAAISEIAINAGLKVQLKHDLGGNPRCLMLQTA